MSHVKKNILHRPRHRARYMAEEDQGDLLLHRCWSLQPWNLTTM